MVSMDTFMVVNSMAANQKDMVHRYETELAEAGEVLELFDKALDNQLATNDELRKQLKDVRDKLWKSEFFFKHCFAQWQERGKAIEALQQEKAALAKQVLDLQGQVAESGKETTTTLMYAAVHIARAAAHAEQVEALTKQHPDTPLLEPASSGDQRTHLQVTYDTTYWATLKALKLTNEGIERANTLYKNPHLQRIDEPSAPQEKAAPTSGLTP